MQQADAPKCQHCRSFYAHPAFQGYCSKCYNHHAKPKLALPSLEDPQLNTQMASLNLAHQEEEKTLGKGEERDRKRCFECKRKVGLLGVQCKCGEVFCNGHRMAQDHECSFNHRADDRLRRELKKVTHAKIVDF